MIKSFVEWNGEKFPVRTINLPDEYDYNNPVDVADYDLYQAYEDEYEKDNKEAVAIDNSIFFFCNSGFIESDPTDEEIIEYLIKAGI